MALSRFFNVANILRPRAPMPITVILTSYNHGKYIGSAIESVLSQSFGDFELVIFDDVSDDNSWDIIRSVKDRRVRRVRNDRRRGPAYGINRAIAEAQASSLIAIHHSDDIWEKDKLARQLEVMQASPDCGAVFTNADAINENGTALEEPDHFYSRIFKQKNRSRREWVHDLFMYGNVLCHPSALIRRDVFTKVGSYSGVFAQLGDYEMWVRLSIQYGIHVIEDPLVQYRILAQEGNASGDRPSTRVRLNYEMYQILGRFGAIGSTRELIATFPELRDYDRRNGDDFEFVFAMLLIKFSPYYFAPLLGLSILTRIMDDRPRAEKVKSLYGFGGVEYFELTGTCDVFARLEVERLRESLSAEKLNKEPTVSM